MPLDEKELKDVMSPEYMVFNRKGLGGSQLGEVERMLSEHQTRLSGDKAWIKINTINYFLNLVSKADMK